MKTKLIPFLTLLTLMGGLCASPLTATAQSASGTMQDIAYYFDSPSFVASSQLPFTAPEMRNFFEHAEIFKSSGDIYSHAMSRYITKAYNQYGYAQTLSQNGSHITQFLDVAREFNLSVEHIYTGLRLFYNKLGAADIIDDTVMSHVIGALPQYLEFYFPLQTHRTHTTFTRSPGKTIENCVLNFVTEHLQTKQPAAPESFFTELSQKVADLVVKNQEQADTNAMRQQLRFQVIQLCERILNKTVWYPEFYQGIWQSVESAAHNIHMLGANNIITHLDHVDNLLWTLVNRFCQFLDQSGSQLPLDFYEYVEHKITSGMVPFLEDQELDHGILSKKDHLVQSLANAKIKALALSKHGIIT